MVKPDLDELFENFKTIKAAVIGDVMLDTYWWGHVERISPEAPVPIVALDKKELRIGGAGNVALNLIALGAQVTIFSAIGEDEDGKQLDYLLNESGIDTSYLVCTTKRKTTNKTRVISRSQQMMRLDSETTDDINTDTETALLERIRDYIKKENPHLLIFEDYNKGVLTERVIKEVIALCKAANIITAVDPKKKNFFAYQSVDIFKPNLKEVKEGLNLSIEKVDEPMLEQIHMQLQAGLHHHISFITLSEKGVFVKSANEQAWVPSHIRNIADVSGAGDTVIAVASLVYATTQNTVMMAEIANIAGGLVCEEVGTAPIRRDRLLAETKILLQ